MSATLRCLCRGVHMTISGESKGAVLCHCSNCQNVTGSAFAHNTRFMKAKMDFHQGKELIKAYNDKNTKSGNSLQRHFCSNCGSSLFLQSSAIPGLTIAHCGVVEGGDSLKPKFELFEENRRSWMGKVNSGPKL